MQVQSLAQALSARTGQFVPKSNAQHFFSKIKGWEANIDGIQLILISTKKHVEDARKFWLNSDHFWADAVIPKSLGLNKQGCPYTTAHLARELDVYLESGVSLIGYVDDNVVCSCLNAVWKRDDSYEVLEGDMLTWHNTAAELAAQSELLATRHVLWRDLQYQHIYNNAQKYMKMYNKELVFYCGMGYTTAEYRHGGLMIKIIERFFTEWKLYDKCIYLTISTMPFSKKYVKKNLVKNIANVKSRAKGVEHIVDIVDYSEENLVLDGVRVFDAFSHLGPSMVFHAVIPKSRPILSRL